MDKVQLWLCRLDPAHLPLRRMQERLSPDAQQRLDQMQAPAQRQQRILGWFLRDQMLARYLNCPVSKLRYGEVAHGKPVLHAPDPTVQFNLSHAPGALALAVARRAVGVDVETTQRDVDWQRIGRRLFHPSETQRLRGLEAARRPQAGVELWSAKEAWSKAAGRGLVGFKQVPELCWRADGWSCASDELWQCRLRDHILSLVLPGADDVPAVCLQEVRSIKLADEHCHIQIVKSMDEDQ